MKYNYKLLNETLIRLLQERWQARCSELKDWVTHAGALPRTSDQLACGFLIGWWLSRQRKKLRNSRLETAQLHELDVAAPGWRDGIHADQESNKKHPSIVELAREDAFLETLSEVAAFIDTHDRFPVSEVEPDERRLVNFITSCRRRQGEGRLVLERAKLLDETLPGWGSTELKYCTHDKSWEVGLAVLVTFCNEFGRLPKGKGASARWLYRQRANFKAGQLIKYRESALDVAVPGWKGLQTSEKNVKMV